MKILLIQSRVRRERAERERAEFARALPPGAVLECISVLDETKLWSDPVRLLAGFDAVFIGGSGDFHLHGGNANDEACIQARRILEQLRSLIEWLMQSTLPVLGVCFGHQLIAEVMEGGVTSDVEQKKTGTYEVRLTAAGKDDPLFKEFPESFFAQYAHKDSVTSLPRGAALLASGLSCRFSALRYGPRVYTVQFHPESTRESMLEMAYQMPHYLPEGKTPEELFRESPDASKLIGIFAQNIIR